MPNNPRQHYKRKLEQVERHLEAAQAGLAEVIAAYKPNHDEITKPLDTAGEGIEIIRVAIVAQRVLL